MSIKNKLKQSKYHCIGQQVHKSCNIVNTVLSTFLQFDNFITYITNFYKTAQKIIRKVKLREHN